MVSGASTMTATAPGGFTNTEASAVSGENLSFSFGANWQEYLGRLKPEDIDNAVESFKKFTQLNDLTNFDFLDLGSGSGLSSLVALRLGARRVLSIDVDPHSVAATTTLRDKLGLSSDRWEIRTGSVLDRNFLSSLGKFNYVHSWGVLHHTGQMWQAIENVIETTIAPGGLFHTALYNRHRTAHTWLRIKRWCNRSPHVVFPLIKWTYITALFAKMLLRGKSPFKYVREYNKRRGMNFYRDVDDWIGGLPYEYCGADELVNYMSNKGLFLRRLSCTDSCGCNEFLFHSATV
jgi:SAM-dependent methyltransferase